MALNDVYFFVYVNMQLKKSGGGGSGLDYVILLSQKGWVLITEGVKNAKK